MANRNITLWLPDHGTANTCEFRGSPIHQEKVGQVPPTPPPSVALGGAQFIAHFNAKDPAWGRRQTWQCRSSPVMLPP